MADLRSDSNGFVIGTRRLAEMNKGINQIDENTKNILELLRASIDALGKQQVSAIERLLLESKKGNLRQTKIAEALDRANRPNLPRPSRNPPENLSDRTDSGNNDSESPSQQRRRRPTVDTEGTPRGTPQRDARGRFIGSGNSAAENAKTENNLTRAFSKAIDLVGIPKNSTGIDPTIDAIHEIGGIISPAARGFRMMGRGANWLFKRRTKRDELLPEEQSRHNRDVDRHNQEQRKLLKIIARRLAGAGAGLPGAGLLGGLLRGGGKGLGKLLKFGKGIPLLGTAIGAMSLMDWDEKSTAEKGGSVGGIAGGVAGGVIGSALGPVGTVVGGAVGAWIGNKLGNVVTPYIANWTNSLIRADIPGRIVAAWEVFTDGLTDYFKGKVDSVKDKAKSVADFGYSMTDRGLAFFGNKGAQDRVKQRDNGEIGYQSGGVSKGPTMGEVLSDTGKALTTQPSPKSLEGKPMNVAVYEAYRKQGLSHEQALGITGEVGRENDFNSNVIFGKHTDPAKDGKGSSITNMGMLSWNRERATALQAHLKKRGVLDKNGNMIKSQAALDAQAEFSVNEMKGKYKDRLTNFWNNPNADPDSYARELGKNYVGWAYGQKTIKGPNGTRVPFDASVHDNKRAKYVDKTDKDVKKYYASKPKVSETQQSASKTLVPKTNASAVQSPAIGQKPSVVNKGQTVQSVGMPTQQKPVKQPVPKQPKVEKVHTPVSSKPQSTANQPLNAAISQNVSDRGLAHTLTGGLGSNNLMG